MTSCKKLTQEIAEYREQLERLIFQLSELQDLLVQVAQELPTYQQQIQDLQFRVAVSRELL